jgi:hypothetical protein
MKKVKIPSSSPNKLPIYFSISSPVIFAIMHHVYNYQLKMVSIYFYRIPISFHQTNSIDLLLIYAYFFSTNMRIYYTYIDNYPNYPDAGICR